jgi:hypothetical protein
MRLPRASFVICCTQPSPTDVTPCQAVSGSPPAVIIRTSNQLRTLPGWPGRSNSSTGNTDEILVSDPSLPIFSLFPSYDSMSSAGTSAPICGKGFRVADHLTPLEPLLSFISATYVLLFSLYGPREKESIDVKHINLVLRTRHLNDSSTVVAESSSHSGTPLPSLRLSSEH